MKICNYAKGQTNSKWFFQVDVSSKKRAKKFDFLPKSTMNEFVRSFFGGIRGYQKVLSKLTDL